MEDGVSAGSPILFFLSFAPLNLATNGTRGHDRSWPVAEGRGVVVGICTGAALDGLALHCIVHAVACLLMRKCLVRAVWKGWPHLFPSRLRRCWAT